MFFDHIARQAASQPEAIAIASPGRPSLNYRQLVETVQAAITRLHESGLQKNDRIAIVLNNSPEMATACLMAASLGSCVPLNPDYTTADFDYFYSTLGIKLLISDAHVQSPAAAVARKAGIAVVELNYTSEAEAGLLVFKPPPLTLNPTATNSNEQPIAFILHTSGSTAKPKIVPLSHQNIIRLKSFAY